MTTKKSSMRKLLTLSTLFVSGTLVLIASCVSAAEAGNQANRPASEKSGSELWAENCRRCHNFRSPSGYSDSEWEAAMFHMRVRANLTGDEYESITKFLKSSN